MPKKSKPKTFSSAFKELEKIAEEFETGDIDLEVSIPKFKRAAELSKYLKKRLSELENEIEKISLDIKDTQTPTPTSDEIEF